jgi:hypothetical protein
MAAADVPTQTACRARPLAGDGRRIALRAPIGHPLRVYAVRMISPLPFIETAGKNRTVPRNLVSAYCLLMRCSTSNSPTFG